LDHPNEVSQRGLARGRAGEVLESIKIVKLEPDASQRRCTARPRCSAPPTPRRWSPRR